jgi:hypothetical protein
MSAAAARGTDRRSGKVVQFKALLMTVRHFGLAALCGGCSRAAVAHRSLQKRFSVVP